MTGGRPWTSDEDAQLSAMLANGMSHVGIGIRLGRTGVSVCNRANTLRTRERAREVKPLPEPVNRDCCWRCGVRADIGCYHSRQAA